MKKQVEESVLRNFIAMASMKFNASEEEILGHSKKQNFVEARRFVSIRLRSLGYTYPVIARALNKHHTTIMHLVDYKMQLKRQEQYLKRRGKL